MGPAGSDQLSLLAVPADQDLHLRHFVPGSAAALYASISRSTWWITSLWSP